MKWYLALFCAMIIIIFLVTIESIRENRKIRINSYRIKNKNIPDWLKGRKMVFISDYHTALNGKNNNKIIENINKLNPVAVLVGGDMVTGHPGADQSSAVQLINSLSKNYPVFYAMGNHEMRIRENEEYGDMWKNYKASLDGGVKFLDNEMAELSVGGAKDTISIYGLSIDRPYYRRFILHDMNKEYIDSKLGVKRESLSSDKKDIFTILLAHNPDYFETYAEWGADVSLSGHFHGGIIRLPFVGGLVSPRLVLFPKYSKGLYHFSERLMILTSGLGQHSIKVRINNYPEIVVMDFE